MSGEASEIATALDVAAFSPELVPTVMQRAARLCGGELAIAFNADPGKPDLLGDDRATEMQRDYLAGGWKDADILTQAIRRLQRGGIRHSHDIVGLHTLRKHPFFQEYLVRHGGPWGMGWHVSTSAENDIVSIAGNRPFQREQVELLQCLAPRIDATLLTASSIVAVRAQGAAEGIELAGRGAILLDGRGRACYISATAESYFCPEFDLVDGRLRASDPASMRELSKITAAAQSRLATNTGCALVRRKDNWPIALVGKRVAGAGLDLFRGGRLLLMLVELKPTANPSHTILRQLYGLTSREACVASLFASGASAQEISAALSLRASTVRQQIKAVLTKTETHRQAELALLLATIPDNPVADDCP